MTEKQLIISYSEGNDWADLPDTHQRLIFAAIEVSEKAYAPYSKFKVGAALLTNEGTLITGNNQENAAYPMCNCAERVAIQKTYSGNPDIAVTMMAIYAQGGRSELPTAPCGACRQVLCETTERSGSAFPIILVGTNRSYRIFQKASDLLPLNFKRSDLNL